MLVLIGLILPFCHSNHSTGFGLPTTTGSISSTRFDHLLSLLFHLLATLFLSLAPLSFCLAMDSFGFGIGLDTFSSLFKLNRDEPSTLQLWHCWDTDGNGVTDVLEIFSALTLISHGKFEEKLESCFQLFDFDENKVLTADEMAICIRTSVCGLCKLLDMDEPPLDEIDKLGAKAFNIVGTGAKSITQEQFLKYVVCTPTIISTICRFGTNNGEQVRRKYAELMAEDKAAIKIQSAYKLSKGANGAARPTTSKTQVQAKIDSHRRKDDPNYYPSFDFSPYAIKRAKHIFDTIDQDGSGEISITELAASMSGQEFASAAISAFKAMDSDGSGTLTFDEMLRVLYPNAKPFDIKLMLRETHGVSVDKETVQALQIWFESHDDDFDGKIILKDVITALQRDRVFKAYVDGYVVNAKLANKPVGFTTLLSELFSTNQKSKFQQILTWSRLNGPVHQLDLSQQAELETLFSLYDRDHSGTITMVELKSHFESLGFSNDEIQRLFAKYDQDGNQKVDLNEFKHFYRSVWETTARMHPPAPAAAAAAAASSPSPHSATRQFRPNSSTRATPHAQMEEEYR